MAPGKESACQGRRCGLDAWVGQIPWRILAAVVEGVFLLAAMAGGVAVAVGDGPGQGQSALLVLAKVAHAQDGSAVGLGVEIAQALGITDVLHAGSAGPLGIGEDVNVRLLAVAYGLGVLVHLNVFIGHVLEVEHPVIEKVLFAFGDEKVSLYHKLGIKADEGLCMVHGLPTGVVNSVHQDLVELFGVNAGLTDDAASGSVTAGDRAIVEKENLGVGLKAELFAAVNGHIGNNGSGGVLCKLISFTQRVYLDYIVSVKRSFDNRAGLGKANFAGADLGNGILSLG